MAKYKDGWHKVAGFDVYVENGRILRGIKYDAGQPLTAYCYHSSKHGGLDHYNPTPDRFRRDVKAKKATLA